MHPALAARPSAQKLLLSATLTRDPGRLNALGLVRPQYFVVTTTGANVDAMDVDTAPDVAEEFGGSLPASLQERMVVCEGADKPLVLAHLLIGTEQQSEEQEPGRGQTLVFCKSVEAATRLAHLLDRVFASLGKTLSVLAYSSDTPRSVLERFRKGDVNVLVCSDLASRGLDVSSVRKVFSYDAPLDMRKVRRCISFGLQRELIHDLLRSMFIVPAVQHVQDATVRRGRYSRRKRRRILSG